jgi:PAS domain S-box-containing protein
LLRAMLSHGPAATAVFDGEGRFVYLSDQLAALSGRSAAAHLGYTPAQSWPDLESALGPRLRRVLACGEPFCNLEVPSSSEGETGESDWLLCSCYPICGAGGAVIGLYAYARDISADRRARAALHEKQETLEALNRVGRLLTAELDLPRLVQTVTDAATAIAGAQFGAFFYRAADERGEKYTLFTLSSNSDEAFAGLPMPRPTAIFGPTFAGDGVVCLADVRTDPRYGHNAPYQGMPPGHPAVASYLAVPVVSGGGEVLGGLFFGHEQVGVFNRREVDAITALAAQTAIAMDNARLMRDARANTARAQTARIEAENASRAKDEFLAVVSHELRTPLTAIRGWLHLLRAGRLDAASYNQGLDALDRSSRAQSQLIEDLLDVSDVVLGKLQLRLQALELAPIVARAVQTVRPAASAKGIALQFAPDATALWVRADDQRLQQIVWNLLSNAVKFTPAGGTVKVDMAAHEGQVEITVSDNGSGIAPEILPYVFHRFRQADGSTTRSHSGLGLGLALVRHLTEMHGGTVRAESDGVGCGSSFIVSLPGAVLRGAGPPPKARTCALPATSDLLSGLRILIVEDEPDTREVLCCALQQYGAQVLAAGDAPSGFALLCKWRPDLLVSDIGLPGEDGYSLIARVRSLPADAGGATPSIALTAYVRGEDRVRILGAGFEAHVPKPVDPAELAGDIAVIVRRG